jgi:D-beta-D-heptose 7-phosphate kinase/D-beta-D-heptose 1-phosphate adenosyltransferase
MIWKNFVVRNLPKRPRVTTNGCFDLFHLGHAEMLRQCDSFGIEAGCHLVVLVNTDASVSRIKPGRPIVPYVERVQMVNHFVPRAWVYPLDADDPSDMLDLIRPKFHLKGDEYKDKFLPERAVVEKHGGQVIFPRRNREIMSTSERIRKIIDLWWERKGELGV